MQIKNLSQLTQIESTNLIAVKISFYPIADHFVCRKNCLLFFFKYFNYVLTITTQRISTQPRVNEAPILTGVTTCLLAGMPSKQIKIYVLPHPHTQGSLYTHGVLL